MGSRSRSSTSASTTNSSMTVGSIDRSDRSFTDNSDNSFTDFSNRSFTDASDNSFNDTSNRSFTDASDNSFNDTSNRSFNDTSDNSFTDMSDNSFNDTSNRSFNDNSDNSFTDISGIQGDNNSIMLSDSGAIAAAESITNNAIFAMESASALNAQVSDAAIRSSQASAERAIEGAGFAISQNTGFLRDVSRDMNDTFENISMTNAQLYQSFSNSQNDALETVERATDQALSIAGEVSRSDNSIVATDIVKYISIAAAVGAIALSVGR